MNLNKETEKLHECASKWDVKKNLRHKSFMKYYSYTIYKENADIDKWNTWRYIWNFKNNSHSIYPIKPIDHENAVKRAINDVSNELISTFGVYTEYLTFVCIPAANEKNNIARYKDFSEKICNKLKMKNAFNHIKYITNGEAHHTGGTKKKKIAIDSKFFKDKNIILFDDVRTTGNSLCFFKNGFEKYGANIIGSITLAQTV